jgi:hypothetical protein
VPEDLARIADRHTRLVEPRSGFMVQIAELQTFEPSRSSSIFPGGLTDFTRPPVTSPKTYFSRPNCSPFGSSLRISKVASNRAEIGTSRAVRVFAFSARIVISRRVIDDSRTCVGHARFDSVPVTD